MGSVCSLALLTCGIGQPPLGYDSEDDAPPKPARRATPVRSNGQRFVWGEAPHM